MEITAWFFSINFWLFYTVNYYLGYFIALSQNDDLAV
jgi:hypothetical protein